MVSVQRTLPQSRIKRFFLILDPSGDPQFAEMWKIFSVSDTVEEKENG